MRDLHRAALDQVSPQVRWKLGPRPASGRRRPAPGWPARPLLAGVGTAVLAVALAAALWRPVASPTPDAAALADVEAARASLDAGDSALAQDPDFYAWLASDDAALIAVE